MRISKCSHTDDERLSACTIGVQVKSIKNDAARQAVTDAIMEITGGPQLDTNPATLGDLISVRDAYGISEAHICFVAGAGMLTTREARASLQHILR